jgi:hypothetical protein
MPDNDKKISLTEHLEKMKSSQDDCTYYALTLTADTTDKIVWSSQTIFAGFENSKRRWELRAGRLLNAAFAENWISLKQPFVFVHSEIDFFIFLTIGGNALIEKTIAEARLSDFLKPKAVAPHGFAGFKCIANVEPSALKRAPTPKVRMQVLNRDDRRCKICGRRPEDDTDLEIHVHHIRPSGNRGLSEVENLITLCSTCHNGLDPHEDWSLFGYLPELSDSFDVDSERNDLIEGIKRYRKISFTAYREATAKKPPSKHKNPKQA